MAGNDVSLAYFCFAGAMIAPAGWLDVAQGRWLRRRRDYGHGHHSQCGTVTSVTVEVEDKGSDTASLSSRKGSIISNISNTPNTRR